MDKKYKLTNEKKLHLGRILYRIQALKDFGDVKEGDLGGFVESEDNLIHYGECWVSGNARVFDNAKVFNNATVFDDARVYGYAVVCDKAVICDEAKILGGVMILGNAEIGGNAIVKNEEDYIIFRNHWSSFRYFTWTRSNNMWRVGCFYGTGEELVKKAYGDNETSGKMYGLYVDLVKRILEEEND